ncbi:hypothetical protein SAMN05444745_11422 [Arthrobacter sp. OV608]|nr:hypothetical protein SAMN05444745_11422 [Arthrobacter sp. OV608]
MSDTRDLALLAGYNELLREPKDRVRAARTKALRTVKRAAAIPAFTRSTINSRSYSARVASMFSSAGLSTSLGCISEDRR